MQPQFFLEHAAHHTPHAVRLPVGGGDNLGDGGTISAGQKVNQYLLCAFATLALRMGLWALVMPFLLFWLWLVFHGLVSVAGVDGDATHAWNGQRIN